MMVACECILNPVFFHNDKRYTICQSPTFVRALSVKAQSTPQEIGL